MEINIRSANASDLSALVAIFRDCWNISYANLLPEDVRSAMTVDAATELWKGAVESHPDRTTLVIEVEGEVAGMARIGKDPEEPTRGHLLSLYISPRFAGKGLGKSLLTSALDSLVNDGFSELSLWVFKDNVTAKSLYEKLNFHPNGRERVDARWKIPEIQLVASSSELKAN
jgi:ribosomal protein S18 acetylase RimI-like enzyme